MNEENKAIAKALNMYGRVPKMWELLEEIERLEKGLEELEELCKTKYYEKNTTDIDSIAIAGNLYVYMYKKIKELKGSDE